MQHSILVKQEKGRSGGGSPLCIIQLNPNAAYQVAVAGFWMGLSGPIERGRALIAGVEKLNPRQPGWLRLVPLLYHLERNELKQAQQEARRFLSPGLAWDPLLRAATAALAGHDEMAASAYRELSELFPEVERDATPYIRSFVHADANIQTLLEGLAKAQNAESG